MIRIRTIVTLLVLFVGVIFILKKSKSPIIDIINSKGWVPFRHSRENESMKNASNERDMLEKKRRLRVAAAQKRADELMELYEINLSAEAEKNPALKKLLQLQEIYKSEESGTYRKRSAEIANWITLAKNPAERTSRIAILTSVSKLTDAISQTYDRLEPDLNEALESNHVQSQKDFFKSLLQQDILPPSSEPSSAEYRDEMTDINQKLYERLESFVVSAGAPKELFDQTYYDSSVNARIGERIERAAGVYISPETVSYANQAGELLMKANDPKSDH